jgi:hypothetical protein
LLFKVEFETLGLPFGSSGLKKPSRSMKRPSRGAAVGDHDVIDRPLLVPARARRSFSDIPDPSSSIANCHL